MSDRSHPSREDVSPSLLKRVDEVCDHFESAWQAGQRPRIEDCLAAVPESERPLLLAELLGLEVAYRRDRSETPLPEEYRQRFPEYAKVVQAVLAGADVPGAGVLDSSKSEISTGPEVAEAGGADRPARLGRYRITGTLGKGGFGLVYKGYDEELRREVAIKVPHRHRIAQPQDVEAYLAEARLLAGLDHPHIVPVHDVGRTEDGLCFVVSKFIEGGDLKATIEEARPSIPESAALVATVAEALHYAHRRGLVHRDVKPGNILIDTTGKAYVADFGLALREEDYGQGATFAGTPAYMSPEQARGEGHRVDGRSDIFSLGVVFYELLTGRRPFRSETRDELLAHIIKAEARPPRQVDDTLPKELERICLKALAKRAAERYTTAKDLADDLRHFLDHVSESEQFAVRAGAAEPAVTTPILTPSLKIVPKGLRSFDATDADFFLELLPGPRDRGGLPESIRFWKTRIEESDPDDTFAVGLLYGPSGCGKSSLMKAGLLPRLAKAVTAVYVEATAADTETRLLKGLRKHCPDLPDDLGLIEALAALRRGRFLPAGTKVLLVLDQFEQWLHAQRSEEHIDLVQALRQCDGGQVQGLVLVRDDFWLAVSRFMQALEIRVVGGENSRLVDLFDPRHATKVLTAFGRAFGALPEWELTQDQHAFLDQAVAGLAEDGKVISVRLALFAEMVKGKPWTPATLKDVGGTEGVGITFLEETFTASTAPPPHRLHQKAAQAVLRVLLPESGTDIKGAMRSGQELLEASGYGSRPKEFEDLIRILDAETRLITPTDPEGKDDAPSPVQAGARYYQLTHDYLVPSLRAWLTRKQKETRRGRAELLLADRAAVWNTRPENRQLPSLLQWVQIRRWTQRKTWTPPQRNMMRKAERHHALRGATIAVVLAVTTVTSLIVRDRVDEQRQATHAAGLVQSLINADTSQVPAIVDEMAAYRKWTDPLLREAFPQGVSVDDRRSLNVSLALLPNDSKQVEYIYERLQFSNPLRELPVLRDALRPHKEEIIERLWSDVLVGRPPEEILVLPYASTLADYAPDDPRWEKAAENVVAYLLGAVHSDPVNVPLWLTYLEPVRIHLIPPLITRYHQKGNAGFDSTTVMQILTVFARDQPKVLAELLLDADDPQQFVGAYYWLSRLRPLALPVLTSEIDKKLPPELPSSDERREKLAKRQANAAVALLRMNQPEKVWPLFKRSPDPRVRSYLVHRLGPLGADAGTIVKRLDEESDVTIRRALLLSLGEFDEKALPPDTRKALLPRLQEIYRTAADPGFHAAVEWLLRQWRQEAWLQGINNDWAYGQVAHGAWRMEGNGRWIPPPATRHPAPGWYVNGQGQTMVVIPGPVEFVMGSPPTEADRRADEVQHKRRIGRTFALAAKPVTVGEFRRFLKENQLEAWFEAGGQAPPLMKKFSPDEDGPIIYVDWYTAAAYCNWLSQQEGIPPDQWCYETNAQQLAREQVSAVALLVVAPHSLAAAANASFFLTDRRPRVIALKKDYLRLRGYRLPTEAEWEYACRAGAVTSRYYGETEELLSRYGWYTKNSAERSWPVGRKKPNDLGLFDMHGNVYTWCQEQYRAYPAPKSSDIAEDREDELHIVSTISRVMRGGSISNHASYVRCADRSRLVPSYRIYNVGLRPARTLTP